MTSRDVLVIDTADILPASVVLRVAAGAAASQFYVLFLSALTRTVGCCTFGV